MRKIYKFPLELNSVYDSQFIETINMPKGAKPLYVGLQNGCPCVWVEVDPEAPLWPVVFMTIGTGHGAVPLIGEYLGTVIQGEMGTYVWHVYWKAQAE